METIKNVVDEILDNKEIPEIKDDEKKDILENKDDEKKPIKPTKKKYTGDLRGFKTYEEAINYPNTDAFSKLDRGCQTEYKNWLKNIM